MKSQKAVTAPLVLFLTCYAFSSFASTEGAVIFNEAVHKIEPVIVVSAKQLTAEEMQNIRGGFIDPTGMIFNFAVNIRTALNGAEIFTKSLTLSPSGPQGQLAATTNMALTPANVPPELSAALIGNGTGVTITDAHGYQTTILNETSKGTPTSIVMNTGSDRDITQTVALTLTLKNMPSLMPFAHSAARSALIQSSSMRSLGF